MKFSLEKSWNGDVFFYYGLSNFYQVGLIFANHINNLNIFDCGINNGFLHAI